MLSKDCDTNHWILCTLAVFAFFWGFDYLVHGKLLMEQYEATSHLWRPMAEMEKFFPWCLLPNLLIAAWVACKYSCFRENTKLGKVGSDNCPIRHSIKFGLWIGVLIGIVEGSAYMYMPIPEDLAWAWFFAALAKFAGAGAALALVYEWKKPAK